ncbi:MAG: sulfatase-like hydrolase/transferase [Cellulosilyticaceae bacterium]
MQKKRGILIKGCLVCSTTFLSVFISEFLVRGNGKDVIQWMKYYDIEFLLTYVLVLGMILMVACMTNKLAYGYLITMVPICTISIINYYKLSMKGEQLSIQDFALAGELATMAGDLEIHISMHLVWGCVFALIIFLLLREMPHFEVRKRVRTLGIMLSVLTVLTMYDSLYAEEKLVKQGFLLTLVNSARMNNIEKPEGYTKSAIEESLQDVTTQKETGVKPNIIMIMSESFFDIRKLEGLALSENPYKYFDQYCEAFTHGEIVGPKVGGYTAQTEYEALTGYSTDFTGVNNIAYLRYVEEGMHSLVSVLGDSGYKKVAIHPYEGSFYSRDEVYKDLGFDAFITRDDFEEPNYINQYISDEDAFKRIIQEYETSGQEPFFAHVVTMQNHTPYGKLDTPTIHSVAPHLEEQVKDTVESYASSIAETDEALHRLITYFEKVEEPTVIVFFGDHIPIMGDEVYEAFEFFDVEETEDYLKGATTPYLIWNNYDLPKEVYPRMDSSYLSALLLHQIDFRQDKYFNLLYEKLQLLPAYHSNFYIDQKGNVKAHESMTTEEEKVLEDMWMVQYDALFGKNYGGK